MKQCIILQELPFIINDTTSSTYTWKFLLLYQVGIKTFSRGGGNYENLHFGSIMSLFSAKAFRAVLKDLKEDSAPESAFSLPPQQGDWQPHDLDTVLKYWFNSGPQGRRSQSLVDFQTSVPVAPGFSTGALCASLIQLQFTDYRTLTLGGDLESV